MSANRSTHEPDEPRDNQDEKQSQWPKNGLAGKLQAAGSRAPDSASSEAVQSMAQLAMEFDLSCHDIEDLWREIEADADGTVSADTVAATLDEWGGAE